LTAAFPPAPRAPLFLAGYSFDQFRNAVVWLLMVSSWFVIKEPAPCDLLFVVSFALFVTSGLRISALIAPMVLYLLLYNLGGFISFIEVAEEDRAGMFVITSIYMSISALFFAFYIAEDPVGRFAFIRNGYIVAAVIGSLIALAGYFDVAGLADTLSPIQRAQGTFKDPNVLSTYLIPPAAILIQGIILGRQRHPLLSAAALAVIAAAIFLAFSRGAWMNFVACTLLLVLITFALTPSLALRSRIVLLSVIGAGIMVVMVIFLLSIPEVRQLFLDRATLLKSYDAGETGRFANQLNSIPFLLTRPLGFGPTLFDRVFGEAPHNVFINAFSAYGWLGGLSYLLLIVSTITIGIKTILTRTPWQNISIVIFCPLFTTILQGVQIDTDHWRHFYWLLGLMWGLYAATVFYVPKPDPRQTGLSEVSRPVR